MQLYTDHVEPFELTGYARQALEDQADNLNTLERWLPNENSPSLTYRVERGIEGLLDTAEYRAYDAEPTTGRREGAARIEGSLPPLGQQYILGEYDQIMARGGGASDEIRNSLLRDAERVATQMSRRMEVARADAIFTGKVTMAEAGAKLDVDFGRRAGNTKVLSAPLNVPASDVLDQLRDILQEYRDVVGQDPGATLANEQMIRAFVLNDEIRTYILGPNAASAQRVRRQDVLDFLADEGFPPFVTNEARATRKTYNEAGQVVGRTTGRITPASTLAFLPAPGAPNVSGQAEGGPLGTTMWGAPLESRFSEYGLAGDEAGIVVAAFIQKVTPVHVNTVGSAIALPVMVNPDAVFTVKAW